jgi:hypothetical protein
MPWLTLCTAVEVKKIETTALKTPHRIQLRPEIPVISTKKTPSK